MGIKSHTKKIIFYYPGRESDEKMHVKGQRASINSLVRVVDSMFYREKEIKKAIKEARLDSGAPGKVGGRHGHAFVSDPTAVQGIKNATELKCVFLYNGELVYNPEKWIQVIEATYKNLKEKEKIIRLRYQGYNQVYICNECYVSRRVYYMILERARNFAIAAACQLGLIKVIE